MFGVVNKTCWTWIKHLNQLCAARTPLPAAQTLHTAWGLEQRSYPVMLLLLQGHCATRKSAWQLELQP